MSHEECRFLKVVDGAFEGLVYPRNLWKSEESSTKHGGEEMMEEQAVVVERVISLMWNFGHIQTARALEDTFSSIMTLQFIKICQIIEMSYQVYLLA